MDSLLSTPSTPLVRLDYTDDTTWQTVAAAVQRPTEDDFRADVTLVEDQALASYDEEALLDLIPDDAEHAIVIAFDRRTVVEPDHPLLVLNCYAEEGESTSFRAVPAAVQSVENNLSLANMDFDDFAESVDSDGVFRGFSDLP